MSDSIGANGSGYFSNVRALLGSSQSAVTGAGEVANAVVHHTGSYGSKICGSSFGNAACVDTWMARSLLNGSRGFDVIHFNWGALPCTGLRLVERGPYFQSCAAM